MVASSYGKDQVVRLIGSVLSKVQASSHVPADGIYHELAELQRLINEARQEIGRANPSDINDKHIPTATDELDAVVEATATATGEIMDACEAVQDIIPSLPEEAGAKISAEMINIFEACTFQDITGQRITKVVSALKDIEKKVQSLLHLLGDAIPSEQVGSEEEVSERDALLNGPQLAGGGVSQDEIDRLLAEFDGEN